MSEELKDKLLEDAEVKNMSISAYMRHLIIEGDKAENNSAVITMAFATGVIAGQKYDDFAKRSALYDMFLVDIGEINKDFIPKSLKLAEEGFYKEFPEYYS